MKKPFIISVSFLLIVVGLFAFSNIRESSVSGKVVPPDAVESIWATGTSDSVKTTPVNGAFAITVKPGTYKVVIDAREPFKDAVLDRIEVKEGKNTDLGEIRLQQ